MPNRILRDGILTSPRVAKLSWPAEVFYRRLHSIVDDFGRYHGDPMMLRAACYPRQLNRVTDPEIEQWLQEGVSARLIYIYEVAGQKYLELLDFKQQVRATKSKFPQPLANAEPVRSNGAAVDHPIVDRVADAQQMHTKAESYSESDAESKSKADSKTESGAKDKAAPRKRGQSNKTQLPADFKISDRVSTWAAEKGFDRLDDHLEFFISKCIAKGYAYVDWDQALMNAIREDWAKLRKNGHGLHPDAEHERRREEARRIAAEHAEGARHAGK